MQIRTNATHERKGGKTIIMFSEPFLQKSENLISVRFIFLKVIKKNLNESAVERLFKPKFLLKSQKDRIRKHCKNLSSIYAKSIGRKIKKHGRKWGHLSLIKTGNFCLFRCS